MTGTLRRGQANGLLLLAAMLWGSGNVAQQQVLVFVGPLTANGLRCLIAAAVVLPFCRREPRGEAALGRNGWMFGSAVAFSFAIATALMQAAYGLTTVTNAGFLVNTCTILTPVAAWFLMKQRPGPIVWPAAVAAFLGAVLMGGGSLAALNFGDVLCLASAMAYAVWMVCLGEFVTRYGRAGVMTVAQFLFAAVFSLAPAPIFETASLSQLFAAAPYLFYLGIVSTGGGYALQAIAQRATPASEAAIIVGSEAVFGAFAAFVLLGERLDAAGFAGAVLIASAIVLLQVPLGRSAEGRGAA
jgi:drug/metabolite transporter (DMT)-like permease